jgi:hypothetical protein
VTLVTKKGLIKISSAPNYRTETQSETLDSSMLPHLNTDSASYEEKEVFCQDVDVFNMGLR